jgi:hypothetical protein
MFSYLLFHLNLSFSSIDEHLYRDVIKKCYWPLLDIPKKLGIKINIESSASTLKKIKLLDSRFIDALKELTSENLVEFVGSGYAQSIFPLFPCELNELNLKRAREVYQDILNYDPSIALVNEMCFSQGLVDLYLADGYKGIVTDIDNVQAKHSKRKLRDYQFISNIDNTKKIGVIWSDSVSFQQFQRYVHGENNLTDYSSFIDKFYETSSKYIPIYSNDAEVFNFRPGRFETEQIIECDEWKKIYNLLNLLQRKYKFRFDLAKNILKSLNQQPSKTLKNPTSILNPIIVKKQPKYNINRWTLTGRNDQFQNKMSYLLFNQLLAGKIPKTRKNIDKLLAFTSSDLRTHVTDKRWIKHTKELENFLVSNNIKIPQKKFFRGEPAIRSLAEIDPKTPQIKFEEEKYMSIKNKNLKLKLNLNKGGAINELAFKSQGFKPSIISMPAGTFEDIEHGVDYFSGLLVAEFLTKRKKHTDLKKLEPKFSCSQSDFKIIFQQSLQYFEMQKIFTIPHDSEKVFVEYRFKNIKPFVGYVRVGNFILNSTNQQIKKISTKLGSKNYETFTLNNFVDHTKPVSTFISSNSGIPASDGVTKIFFLKNNSGLQFEYDINESYGIPMILNKKIGSKNFLRLTYSLREFDDTAKMNSAILPIKISITPL